MKFRCSREQLDRQLQQVSRIVTVRQSLPVLSNVLLETDGSILRLSSTDLELAMTTHLPAKVEQEGTFTVPAKVLQEFVHQNPDEELHFQLEGFELICTSPKVTARLSGLDAEEYPPLPKVENGQKVTLPLSSVVEGLKQVIIACAADQARQVLTGVYLQLEGETATFAATDSFRLVERTIPILPITTPMTLLIPGRSIQELIRSAAILPMEQLELEVGEQQLIFRIGELELYSRLLQGDFPKYQTIIPQTSVAVAELTTSEVLQALRLSTIFSQAGVANVLLEVTEEGVLTISSYGSPRGSTKHSIYALLEEGFQPIRVPFNAKFLLDACQSAGSDHLSFRFSGQTTPLLILSDDPNHLQLVMPIRLDQ